MDKQFIPAIKDKKNPKFKELNKYSNINKAQKRAYELYGPFGTLYISTKKDKKFMIYDIINKKFSHFGQIGYEDFLKHNDEKRREKYLNRAFNIKGSWKKNLFSPNNLSIYILW